MLATLYDLKKHSGTLSEVASYLGLKPFEAGCPEIMDKLIETIQTEVDTFYYPCPLDNDFRPIQPGDNTNFGLVQGIGDGGIFAGVPIQTEGYYGYPCFPAKSCRKEPANGKTLLDVVQNAVKENTLTESQIKVIIDYIGGFENVG